MKNQKLARLKKESGEVVKFDEAGMPQLEVWLENETVWLTQNQMADLFGCAVANINMHLKNIYADGELEEVATIKDFLIVRFEGNRSVARNVKHYTKDYTGTLFLTSTIILRKRRFLSGNCLLLYGLPQCNSIRQRSKPLGVFPPIIGNTVKTGMGVTSI